MFYKSSMKWVAVMGLTLSAVSIFLFTRYNGNQISMTIFSWRPIFDNTNPSTIDSKYRRLGDPVSNLQNSNEYANPQGKYEELKASANKLLWETIDYVFGIGPDIFLPGFDQSQASNPSKPQSPLAPALYVFGDSLSDSGNNNFLQTAVAVNYKPYGVDFPFGPTGRFTNGKTMVDFIAQFLGLPYVPPYFGLSSSDKIGITTGVNYASGSAGILPESGSAYGENLSFDKQIKYFQDTVTNDLPKIFKSLLKRLKYLSKSIFLISIGNNDYINNYLQPAYYNSSQIYTPQQFADLLLDKLVQGLMRLYTLGARKFVVFNIGHIGCAPNLVNSFNPTTPCVDDINNMVLIFNNRLPIKLKVLERILIGSTIVRGDSYGVAQGSSEFSYIHGYKAFTATQSPCCEVDAVGGLCLPDRAPCQDRTKHEYYDAFHPNEALYDRLASDCFNGSVSCVPINIQQLAQKW